MNSFDESSATSSEQLPGNGLVGIPLFGANVPGSQPGVTPAGESGATTGPESRNAGPTINYHFPIEVVVIGAPSRDQIQMVADYVYDQLLTALETA